VANSFARTAWGGNPAGVVVGYNCLDTETMQCIARQLNLVETVFVCWEADSREVSLRYFTPAKELEMAGHPTIAAFMILIKKYFKAPLEGQYSIQTKGGRQNVTVIKTETDYVVTMEQKIACFLNEEKNIQKVACTLGISVHDFSNDLPIEAVDTGLGHLIVPVNSIEALDKIERNIDALKELCQESGVKEVQP
jgi:trans-2,3-dihydro-3-hydroxyanthranilate isomerase